MSENRKRYIQVKFRVTPDEHIKILEKAKLSNMQIGRYIRNSTLKRNIIVYDFTSIFELSAQVSRIGNNINQIARKLNQGGITNKSEVDFLKSSLKNINNVLMEIYKDFQKSQDEA